MNYETKLITGRYSQGNIKPSVLHKYLTRKISLSFLQSVSFFVNNFVFSRYSISGAFNCVLYVNIIHNNFL